MLDRGVIERVDLAGLAAHARWNREYLRYFLDEGPGREHYRLLGFLSLVLPPGGTVVDVGTNLGHSALALALDPSKRVVSYDLVDRLPRGQGPTARDRRNIELRLGDCVPDLLGGLAREACLVMIDIDHRGDDEARLMQALRDAGYRGLVLLDDIHLNPGMEAFWHGIPEPKLDATSVGHSTGTGLVMFGEVGARLVAQRQ